MQAKILAVDDEQDIAEILKEFLQFEGHNVVTTYSGYEAINILKEKQFDIIISDFHMRNGTGLELLEFTKNLSPAPIFIFLSAANHEVEKICMNFGAHKFFHKPFTAIEICYEINAMLKKQKKI